MSDLNIKEIPDALFTSFFARDFFAKVLPGGLVLGVLVYFNKSIFSDLGTLDDIPNLVWLLIYGFSWILGFSIQSIGEFIGLLRAFPIDESEDDFRLRMIQFNAIKNETDGIQRERYVVIKEASGNIVVAGLLVAIIFTQHCIAPTLGPWFNIFLGFLFLVSLWWNHVLTRRKQRELERKIVNKAS